MSTIDKTVDASPGVLDPDRPKLNIGGGATPLDGYYTVDAMFGGDAELLTGPDEKLIPDESVDEVYASHILEHISWQRVEHVLTEWVRVLKPGGILRVAVPDLAKTMEYYSQPEVQAAVAAHEFPMMGAVVMGGQTDSNDYHKSCWGEVDLMGIFRELGLVCVKPFRAMHDDCSRYPFSANVEGVKRTETMLKAPHDNIALAMSVPRLGFSINSLAIMHSILQFNIRAHMESGAYFDLSMEDALKSAIDTGKKYIVTTDYDTVFEPDDLRMLTMMMDLHPEFDCICATQMRRGEHRVLMGDGSKTGEHDYASFTREVVPVQSAHFGLTMFRREAFDNMVYPWMRHKDVYTVLGDYAHTVHADIVFWQNWKACGNTLGVTPRVKIGHPEETITWPGDNFQPVYQTDVDYRANGRPEGTQ